MNTTVISIHSAFGGAGKTTIALAAALQLAAKGCKIALIDLSAPCNGFLSQWLAPVFLKERNGVFSYFACLATGFSTKHWTNQASAKLNLPSVAAQNLHIFCGSPDAESAVSLLNRIVLSDSGPATFHEPAKKLITRLHVEGFRYIIIDNAPGFTFLPGIVTSFVFESAVAAAAEESEYSYEYWLVTRSPDVELGLTLYELAIYKDFVKYVSPKLLVNQAQDVSPVSVERARDSVSHTPVWERVLETNPGWIGEFLSGIQYVTLGFDPAIRRDDPKQELTKIVQKQGLAYQIDTQLLAGYELR